MRIHILGLGAIGGLLAVRLANFHSVCAILRSDPALSKNKLVKNNEICRPHRQSETFTKKPELHEVHIGYCQAAELPVILPAADFAIEWQLADDNEPIDYLLLTTKSFQTESALNSIQPRIHSSTMIVLMQNGLSSQYQAAGLLSEYQLFAATTTEAANQSRVSRSSQYSAIKHAAAGVTRVGAISPAAAERGCKILVAALNQTGILATEERDIWRSLWQKFAINCGINAYTAIIGCRNGAILEHQIFKSTIGDLCTELAQILTVAGYPEDNREIERRIMHVATATGNNISSMLQDVRAGRQTEIEAINGFAVNFAKQHGITTPVNAMLTKKVSELQHSQATRITP